MDASMSYDVLNDFQTERGGFLFCKGYFLDLGSELSFEKDKETHAWFGCRK